MAFYRKGKRTKAEVRELIKKCAGGWEAGLLVFEHAWLDLKDPEAGFLTESNIETIKSKLVGGEDNEAYATVISLYRTASYMEREAKTELLLACALLERMIGVIYYWIWKTAKEEGAERKSLSQLFEYPAGQAKASLLKMEARKQVLEELGKVVGMKLEEELDLIIEVMLKPVLERHKLMKLPPLPDKRKDSDLDYVRSWLNDELGEEWWRRRISENPPVSVLPESVREYWEKLGLGEKAGFDELMLQQVEAAVLDKAKIGKRKDPELMTVHELSRAAMEYVASVNRSRELLRERECLVSDLEKLGMEIGQSERAIKELAEQAGLNEAQAVKTVKTLSGRYNALGRQYSDKKIQVHLLTERLEETQKRADEMLTKLRRTQEEL